MTSITERLNEVKEGLFKPPLEATTLPGEFYYEDKYYKSEIEHIFKKKWMCAGRVEDIPEPGDFMTETIGDIPVIIVRTAENKIKSHINVCRHRGCQIVEESGSTKAFKCPYHGWLYGLDGELRGTPDFDNTKNFDKKDNSLHPVLVEIWEGFIMINLDPNASSFGESISDTRKFGVHKYKMGDMKTYQSWDFTLNCNWKAFVDNAMEYYHVPWVHPITFQANTPLRIWKDMPHISDQDFILMIGQKPGASYSSTGEPLLHVPEELSTLEPEYDGMPIWAAYPTFVCLPVVDCMLYYKIYPRGPEKTNIRIYFCIHDRDYQKVQDGDSETIKAVEEYTEGVAYFAEEDNVIAEQQQRGLKANANSGRFSYHESLIHRFNKWVFETAYEPMMESDE